MLNQAPRVSDRLLLQHGPHEVELAPSLGGAVARYCTYTPRGVEHWLRPASLATLQAGDVRGMASFALIPWSNRMRDARSDFGGRPLRPSPDPGSAPHAIHGLAWKAAWQVCTQQPMRLQAQAPLEQAQVTLRWLHEADTAWPYRFGCTQTYTLASDGRLGLDTVLHNLDNAPMPAGLGHHPYLPHAEAAQLHTEVQGLWTVDHEKMPVAWTPAPQAAALRSGTAVVGLDLDHAFTGWGRHALVTWPARGTSLRITASEELSCLVVYTPAHRGFFCIEPVSHTTDWMNLHASGAGPVGGHVLAAGDSLSARVSFTPTWA